MINFRGEACNDDASEAHDHGTPRDRQAAKLSWLLWMAVALIGIWPGVLLREHC